eukprot:scaffold44388_cov63-Phaeocystis_antarctica.AAC.2
MHIGAGLVAEHAVAAVPEDAESRDAPNEDVEGFAVVIAEFSVAGDERQDGRGGDDKVQRDEEHPCAVARSLSVGGTVRVVGAVTGGVHTHVT